MPNTIAETIWPADPHTLAKHEILRRYLGAWFPILSSWNGRIIYVDGFCGPGEYERGEPGSPIIALDVATTADRQRGLAREVLFLFSDEDDRRIAHLEDMLRQRTYPAKFQINVRCGQFHNVLQEVLDYLEQRNLAIAPTFAFIDPFGFSGVHMSLLHRLLSHRSTEAFITFMVQSVNRFVEHPNPKTRAHMVQLFGTEDVLPLLNPGPSRFDALRELYQRQLGIASRHVRYFRMYDEDNVPIYDLFFATNSEKGLVKMKEAMWAVDPEGTFSFSDATNPGQPLLLQANPSGALLGEIVRRYRGYSGLDVAQVRQWVESSTPYLSSHMKKALCLAEDNADIIIDPVKRNGERRRKHAFPDGVIISIPA